MIEFSEIQNSYFILPLIGFVIGLFGTMLGGGGGFFFIPLLTLWIGVPAQTAVITSLVATLPICMVGTLGHYHRKNVDFRIAGIFIAAGMIGAFSGAGITRMISTMQLKIAFGIYSILIAFNMIAGTLKKKKTDNEKTNQKMVSPKVVKTIKGSFFGLAAGMITGTFGTSGTAPVLAGLFSLKIPVSMVIGTSLLVVLANTLFAVGAHFLMGKIDLTLVLFLTAGSAIGALVGPGLLSKIKPDKSENKVKYLYAAVMVAIGVLMIIGKN